jgi:hypothetical protein
MPPAFRERRARAYNEGLLPDDVPTRVMDDADVDPEAEGGETEASVRGPHPFDPSSPLLEHWDELMGDAAATAEIYREEGWDVLELHPTDAAALTDTEAPGIEVTVPTDEFERLDSLVESGRFAEYEVYRAETGRVFLLVVARDETGHRMVCVPAHYGFESVSALADRADATGRFLTHIQRADGERVTLTHDDPGPFLPGGGSGSSEPEGSDARRGGDGRTGGSGSGSG